VKVLSGVLVQNFKFSLSFSCQKERRFSDIWAFEKVAAAKTIGRQKMLQRPVFCANCRTFFKHPYTAKRTSMEKEKEYRQLHLPIRRPRPINDRFAWLAGTALAVLFLACVAMAYVAQHHK
jgi:hypothetical protein